MHITKPASDDARLADLRPSPTGGLPIAPSLRPTIEAGHLRRHPAPLTARAAWIVVLAIGVAIAMAFVAPLLNLLIEGVTNLAFYGRPSLAHASPAHHALGAWVIGVPALGGVVVGFMARYGAQAIRGHGIPEAMEQVLLNDSRIPWRITFLKPLSAAIAIGSGGPFGAEGPVIATGGALGSALGQLLTVSAAERKTLLAAGAAAGMAAVFGSPLSALLLAIELLLFELRPGSLIAVALAVATSAGIRGALFGWSPLFAMAPLPPPAPGALLAYTVLGLAMGAVSIGVTRAVYVTEDAFARIPVHWMWWPALGGLVVGAVGYLEPLTLGVGYDNIQNLVDGRFPLAVVASLCLFKFLSWSVALGSGTSGGTLAPLLTVGGALGSLAGAAALALLPGAGIDPRMAALVGMAAMFAGASRAVLASAVFAFEVTQQTSALLPLIAGCGAAYLVSCLLMKNSIMTEKIVRRGVRVPSEYAGDVLDQVSAGKACSRKLVWLDGAQTVAAARAWLNSGRPEAEHQGFPVLDAAGHLIGVVTRKDVFRAADGQRPIGELIGRAPVVIAENHTLREAAERMVAEGIGRLIVVAAGRPGCVVGILTRADVLAGHAHRLREKRVAPGWWGARRTAEAQQATVGPQAATQEG